VKTLLAGIFILACQGQPAFSKTYLWSELSAAPVMDDNVYKDNRKYKDTGYKGGFNLGARSKLSKTTSGRFRYGFGVSAFPKYDLQDTRSHSFEAVLKQRLGDIFDLDLDAGFSLLQMPNADIYNSNKLSLQPLLKWNVFDHTTIGAGYIHEKTGYSKYDLDNKVAGLRLKFAQELSPYTDLEVSGVLKTRKYSEQQLLELSEVSVGTSAYLTDKREDNENSVELGLQHNINAKTGFGLNYSLGGLYSNGNYLNWGPNQSESKNTIANDDKIIPGYRSYKSERYGLNYFTGFIGGSNVYLMASYGTTDYSRRLAKDGNDALTAAKRQDKQTFVSVTWSKSIVSLKYSYEKNKSNDALYSYANNIASLNISICLS